MLSLRLGLGSREEIRAELAFITVFRSLLAQRWFFSGGWWCRRRSPAPLGAFLTRRWLLPWGDIFRTCRTRRHHLGS
jgi:hypothetical protein